MAEFVVGLVKDKLGSFLKDEATLLKDVHQDVEEIKQELLSIQSFLKDADKRAEAEEGVSDGVRAWVQELREVAFIVEDVVTEYKHCEAQKQRLGPRGILEFVRETVSSIFSLRERRDLASQIHDIKRRLIGIHQRSERYGFRNSIQRGSSSSTFVGNVLRRASPFVEEDHLVGIESARDDLMGRLVYGSSQLTVISVVGEGGSGKTTLARQVYDRVHREFQCHAWLVAPEPYSREDLLRKLAIELFQSCKTSIPSEIDRMDEHKLTGNLREFLRGKRYFVVVDDIWKEDFWSDVESALIDSGTGGRILLTTRKMQVADICKRAPCVHTHKMSPLPPEKAFELFCKKAFRPVGRCPRELENLSIKIVERCGRLPLAIIAIAGLLFTKEKTVEEWERFHGSLSSELESDPELKNVIKILSLSYNDLPSNLKSCFLYFGMFPRYYNIRNGRLIQQWIAQGFVKPEEGKTLEEVAQAYMNELINRSLVEASLLNVTGRTKRCRVHDLLHEIILKKSKDISFSQVLRGRGESSLKGIARRFSLFNTSSHSLEGIKSPHTHSVVVLTEDETFSDAMHAFATNFKFFKVLDFENAPWLYHLPEDIGNLFDLRYLSVRWTKVKMLPKSIEKLENLETLDLKESMVYEIPADTINKLCKLRNLFAHNLKFDKPGKIGQISRITGVKVAGGIGHLKSLQKLYNVDAVDNGVELFGELRNLTQLKTFGVTKLRSEDGSALCDCLEQMTLLETLFVSSTSENETIDLDSMSSPPRFLRHLDLNGRLTKLPKWITQLENLVKIRLWFSNLEDDALQVLKNMHNLLELWFLFDAYAGEHLLFDAGAFPNLKKLYLSCFSRLRSLAIEETALPMLESLTIGHCPAMTEFPSGLQHLRNLKSIAFHDMAREIMASDFRTLQHVPDIQLASTTNGGPEKNIPVIEFLNFRTKVSYEQDFQGRIVCVKRARTDEDIDGLFEDLKKLTQLKKLGIVRVRSQDGKSLCSCVEMMSHLESLSIATTSAEFKEEEEEEEFIDLESLSSPPRFLQRLYLVGRLTKLPEWMAKLENLVELKVASAKLGHENPLRAIQALQNLAELEICDAYEGDELRFERGSFPRLLILSLKGLRRLKRLVIEEGAMRVLDHLHISQCPKLEEVPPGIRHLRELGCLLIEEISDEFVENIRSSQEREKQQRCYAVVEHISTVRNWVLP